MWARTFGRLCTGSITLTCHFLLSVRFSTCQACTSEVSQDRVVLQASGLGAEVSEPSVVRPLPHPPPQLPLRPPLSRDCRDLLQRLLERDPSRRISFQDFFAHPWVDLEHMPSGESLARAVSRPAGMGRGQGGLGVSSAPYSGEG